MTHNTGREGHPTPIPFPSEETLRHRILTPCSPSVFFGVLEDSRFVPTYDVVFLFLWFFSLLFTDGVIPRIKVTKNLGVPNHSTSYL